MGASKLRRSKESTESNSAASEKQEEPDKYRLMEFAFRMGQSSLPSASSVAPPSAPQEPAAPVFPALEDGCVDDPPSSDPAAKASPVAEVYFFFGCLTGVASSKMGWFCLGSIFGSM